MCGICGDLRLAGQGRVSSDMVRRMRETLEHRGPDDAGLYTSEGGEIGLGFRRLRILDLTPNANQPMSNEDGSVRVVFNGEIYNYLEIRRRLEGRHQFRSHADTEVIVHLYEEKGADAIADLDGMFAIAIWDARARRLLLARDRAGKKPLFFLTRPNRFAFASEIKAFFADPELAPEPDPASFPSLFLHGYVPSPGTVYRDVRQVPPASVMTVDVAGTTSTRQYWTLRYPARAARTAAPSVSLADAAARVRELTEQAVTRRLMSDVPIGAFLSGGLDSSIIVGLMSRHMQAPVKTFSIGFEGDAAYDETSYARIVSERFATEHTEFRVTPSAIDLVEKLVWHHDGPFADASAIPTYIVSKLTKQHVTVALTGDGGDELFAGYVRFAAALAAERLPRPLRRVMSLVLSGLPAPASSRHVVARAARFARALELPLHERMTRWSGLFYDDIAGLFNRDSMASFEQFEPLAYLSEDLAAMKPMSTLSQILYANYRSYLLNDLLVKSDRCSMANGLELRSPFLDRELTEYVAALPDEFKLKNFKTKVVLRQAFADLVPPAITGRPKMGFGVPLDAWFRGDLRDYVRDMLLGRDARHTTYLSRTRVATLLDSHQSGNANIGLQLWTLLTFEVWLRQLASWARPAVVEAV